MPLGNYNLSYQATVGGFLAGGAVLQNQAWLTALGQAPQTVSASVTVNGEFTVRIGVYNEAGELVKEILIKQYSEPIENIQIGPTTVINSLNAEAQIYYQGVYIGEWDGTTQDGQPAGNGTYFIKVDNVGAFGTVQSVTQPVVDFDEKFPSPAGWPSWLVPSPRRRKPLDNKFELRRSGC